MTEEVSPLPVARRATATGKLPRLDAAPWDTHVNGTRVILGAGRLAGLGTLVKELGGSRVLVVTDKGLAQAGHAERALAALRQESLAAAVFTGVEENPTTLHVAAGVEMARQEKIDFIVGLGGGSSMDCAKGINFLLTNGGEMEDYRGSNRATLPMLASVGVPTTAGTGSEAQAYALIARAADREKMACGDDKARFQAVILDPALLVSVPRQVAAMAGMDAIAHAVESFVSLPADDTARIFAAEAWRLLAAHLASALEESADVSAWAPMLWGSHLAGAGIDRAMLGAAHACANPLTARHGVAHGAAVALMLPHVVRFNGEMIAAVYVDLEARAGMAGSSPEGLAARIESLRAACRLPTTLADVGVDEASFPALAEDAARQWTAGFNPRAVTSVDLLELYRQAA